MLTTRFTPATTGVEMGDEHIRVFSLTSQSKAARLGHGRIVTNTSAAVARLENTALTLASVLKHTAIPSRTYLTTAVAYSTTASKEITLPSVADISYYLVQNYNRYMTSPSIDTHWDWVPLTAKNVTQNRILLVTCAKQKIQQLRDMAILAKQKWHAIELDILALHRALRQFTLYRCAAALYLTQSACIFFVFSPNSLVEINAPIMHSQKQSDENILQYVKTCLNTSASDIYGKIEQLIVVGNITTQSDLAARIQLDTNISTIYGNPFENLQETIISNFKIDVTEGPKWALAYGLALRGHHEKY